MKMVLKSSLSLILALTIVLSSASVGFGEIDFGRVGVFLKNLAPDFSFKSQAASVLSSGICGTDLTWTLDDEGTLTISGTGRMSVYGYGDAIPWKLYRSNIINVTVCEGVTSIGNYAFYNCENLTSITIPDSVTSIGNYAFYNCASLTSITIPDSITSIGNYSFYNCESLTSVTIPKSVTSLEDSTFECCTSLTSVTIHDSVTQIEDHVFGLCKSLASITIPDSVTSMGSAVFSCCTSLTSITIPDSVTSVGSGVFVGCTSLKDVKLSDNITKMPTFNTIYGTSFGFFENCTSLTSIEIPDSVKSIDKRAFYNCDSLASITIPDSVTSIGTSAFSGCNPKFLGSKDSYAEIYANNNSIPFVPLDGDESEITISGTYKNVNWQLDKMSGILTISCDGDMPADYPDDSYPWDGYLGFIEQIIVKGTTIIGNVAFAGCSRLTSVTLPEGVTSIGEYAFYGCTSLTSIILPEGLTTIGNIAFKDCTSLASISFPESVTNIGRGAFEGCTSLVSINIPDNLTEMNDLFLYCEFTNLESITVGENNPVFSSVNGVLFNKDQTVLIKYPANKKDVSYTIPDSVTTISDMAFAYNKNLVSIIIPDSVTNIYSQVFYKCTNLELVTIPNSVTSIGFGAFEDCESLKSIEIPNNVTTIESSTFGNCKSLTSISIPDSVTSIDYDAFRKCTGLISVTMPDSVTNIGKNAFSGCTKLTSITIPDSVTSIGDYAFSYCGSLTNITIPNSVTSIGENVFRGCESLTFLSVGADNPRYSSVDGVLFDKEQTTLIQYPASKPDKSYTIPNSVTNIGEAAFEGCTSLNAITIPESVISIDDYAFEDCSSLASITIPDSVTSIGDYAFKNSSFYNAVDNWCSEGFMINGEIVEYNSKGYAQRLLYDIIQNHFEPVYDDDFMTTDEQELAQLKECVEEITAGLETDYEKMAAISEYICENVYYDYDWYYGRRTGLCSSPYDVFINGVTVCEGYANLTNELFKLAGIVVYRVSGYNHVYNMAYDSENEKWIFIDNTWSSGNTFEYSTKISRPYSGSWFDFSLNEFGAENHEMNDLVFNVDGVDYTLVLPSKSADWYNVDKWYFELTGAPSEITECVILDNLFNITVESIGNDAFAFCRSLESVTIPNSVTNMGRHAFTGCSKLKSVTIPDTVTTIGNIAFSSTTTIYCYENSTAHNYAVNNALDYVLINLHSVINKVNIDYDNNLIFTFADICTDYTEIISTSQNNILSVSESFSGGNTKFYGTGSKVVVEDALSNITEYTIITVGDLNGDSVCDVLDAAVAQLYSAGFNEPTENEIYAANGCVSVAIDINTYQNVVNMALI